MKLPHKDVYSRDATETHGQYSKFPLDTAVRLSKWKNERWKRTDMKLFIPDAENTPD